MFTEIFDQMGNLIDRIHYSSKEEPYSPNKWDYIYDTSGNIIKMRYFNQEAVLTGEGLYTYDSNGFLTETAYYSFGVDGTKPEGVFTGGEQYFYDSKGYLVLKYLIAEDHSLSSMEVYVNDAKGNNIIKTRDLQCCTPSTLNKKVMIYDEKGQMTETKSFRENDVLMNTINRSYDEMGNIANITYYGADGSLNFEETRSYEYDKVGNWIKSTERIHYKSSGQESVRVKFRKIIYYSDNQPQ